MHDGTRCALDGTAFPACRYQTQGVSRPSDVIIFSFHDLVVLPRTHARTHANKRKKEKNNDSATCMACTAPRNRVQRAMACWLLQAGLGLNLPKKKNKRDFPPIPQPRFCNTRLHSRRHGAAQLPNPLCRRSLSQISEAFFKMFFFVVVCRRCRVPLPYLTS